MQRETRNKRRKMTRPIRDDRGGKMKQDTQKRRMVIEKLKRGREPHEIKKKRKCKARLGIKRKEEDDKAY